MKERDDKLFELQGPLVELIKSYGLANQDFSILYVKGCMSIIDLENQTIKNKVDELVEQKSSIKTESESLQEN